MKWERSRLPPAIIPAFKLPTWVPSSILSKLTEMRPNNLPSKTKNCRSLCRMRKWNSVIRVFRFSFGSWALLTEVGAKGLLHCLYTHTHMHMHIMYMYICLCYQRLGVCDEFTESEPSKTESCSHVVFHHRRQRTSRYP